MFFTISLQNSSFQWLGGGKEVRIPHLIYVWSRAVFFTFTLIQENIYCMFMKQKQRQYAISLLRLDTSFVLKRKNIKMKDLIQYLSNNLRIFWVRTDVNVLFNMHNLTFSLTFNMLLHFLIILSVIQSYNQYVLILHTLIYIITLLFCQACNNITFNQSFVSSFIRFDSEGEPEKIAKYFIYLTNNGR